MMRLRRASAIVAFFLLASAATASAECAWVLWSTMMKRSILLQHTEPADAFKTKDACDRAFKVAADREDARRKTDPDVSNFYVCLPDTVDPRGPKGN
jgi:hypothetical protein